jgi:ATP synthase F1 epsilon subunit
MARTPFTVEVLTPEGEVFNDEVEMLSTRTPVGSIGVLANHQPLLTLLDPTELRLYRTESDVLRFAQGEGFLQMSGTHALVLVDEVFPIDELDQATISDRLGEAEQRLERAEDDTEEQRQAARDKRRYEAFAQALRDALSARGALATLLRVDERALAERLITYDTSKPDGIRACAGFVKGWLEAREIDVHDTVFGELPVLTADIGASGGTTLIFHGHLDVVPGHAEQFSPRVEGDRLYGRGAYDMKGGLAAMMCAMRDLVDQDAVRVRFVCVPDEESEDIDTRSIDEVVRGGFPADFAITGEPTDLHVGVQAKGVLAFRLNVHGRSAHGPPRGWATTRS